MAVQFSDALIDRLIAPGVSQLSSVTIPSLEGASDQVDHWLTNLFLNSVWGPSYTDTGRQKAASLIFRTRIILRTYEKARGLTADFIAKSSSGRPAIATYFDAVAEWESVLLHAQMTIVFVRKCLSSSYVDQDDVRRMIDAGNRVKHFADDLAQGLIEPDKTLPIWIEPDRLRCRTTYVTFEELAETIRELCRAADLFQLPGGPSQTDA